MQPFKDGAAYLAIKGGVPILPIRLEGMRHILPMHSVHVRPGPVTVYIGETIETSGLTPQARTELTEKLFSTVRDLGVQTVSVS